MVICGQCGAGSEDAERFCGECGAYLEWEGETVVLETAPPVAEQPARARKVDRSGLVERVRAAVGRGSGSEPPGRGLPDTGRPAASPDVIDLASFPAGAGATSATLPSEPPTAAAPVLPGASVPKPRRREVQLEDRRPAPGEVVCGACGAGNVPTRKFCRRCGGDLADAPIARRRPWWQRLFKPDRTPEPAAGARVHRVIFVVLSLLAGGGWASRDRIRRSVDIALDRIKGTQNVEPTTLTARRSAPGHPPKLARDGNTNRFWAPERSDGKGEFLKATFDPAFRLVYVRVFSGASQDLAARLLQASPHAVTLTLTRRDGSTRVKEWELRNEPGQQDIPVGIGDITAVQITIKSAYGVGHGKLVAIGEVEFLGRR
jgi:hypothetical protein